MTVANIPVIRLWEEGVEFHREFSTDVRSYKSWLETRNINWDVRRLSISGDTKNLAADCARQMVALWEQQRGAGLSLLVVDPLYKSVTDQPVLLNGVPWVGNGTEQTGQLALRSTHGGGNPYFHPIRHVESLVIKFAGTPTMAFSETNGAITATPGNGQAVTWSGGPLFPCRFEDEFTVRYLSFDRNGNARHAKVMGLVLVEVFGEE